MHTVTESPDFNNSLDTVISDGITICILWDEFSLEVPIGITDNAFQWGPLISFPLSKNTIKVPLLYTGSSDAIPFTGRPPSTRTHYHFLF